MTEKEKKYKEHFNRIGKHLHKNDYLPINLKCHPMVFRVEVGRGFKNVLVNWGWAVRNENGTAIIPFDGDGNPHPYEGFWEARCFGCTI